MASHKYTMYLVVNCT